MQLNLPHTPIRDLVIKDNDVVLGSHGRGFWILDDIGPLRQLTPTVAQQEKILFQPTDAIRGISDLAATYYLKEQVDSVLIEILDVNGTVVNSFKGDQPAYKVDPNIPWWRRGGSSKPTTKAGMNTFTWDLRYPGATTFDGMIIWSGRPKRGPKAPLGQYQIRLTSGEYSETQAFAVAMNPNLKGITAADLQEQFDLAMKIRDKTSMANEAVIEIRKQREALQEKIKANSLTEAGTKSVLDKMTLIEEALYQVKNQSAQDPLNFPIKLNNRLASLRRSIENGDARPTDGAYQVFKELSAELSKHLSAWDKVKATVEKL